MTRNLGLNARAARLADALVAEAPALRVTVSTGPGGERLVDCGVAVPGSFAAGLALAGICLGGLGAVALAPDPAGSDRPWRVHVRSSLPVLACLGSQYAGWRLDQDGAPGFRGLGSGPARALAATEALFAHLDHREVADEAVLVVESDAAPPPDVLRRVAEACRVPRVRLTVLFAPTASLAGGIQVVARVIEVALTKARQSGFALERIVEALGSAPLPPPHPDPSVAMGRTNDALIYGGSVHLYVSGPAPEARRLAEHLPSAVSPLYGEPFRRIFEAAGRDFYAIDPHLFSPAAVAVTAIDTGDTYRAGAVDDVRIDQAFE